jgi:hypothetical protein
MNSTKLAKLIEQQEKLQAQITLEKNKEKQRKRKNDTKLKVLTGAAILNAVKVGRIPQEKLNHILSEFTTREADRKFLGLEKQPALEQNSGAY